MTAWRRAMVYSLLAPAAAVASLRNSFDQRLYFSTPFPTEQPDPGVFDETPQASHGGGHDPGVFDGETVMNTSDAHLDLCQDLRRLRSVRGEKGARLLKAVDRASAAEKQLDKAAEANEEDSLASPQKLVEYLDAKSVAEHCKAEKRGLQLSLEADKWVQHAAETKRNATKRTMKLLQAHQYESKSERAATSHWELLWKSEETLLRALKDEMKDNAQNVHDQGKWCEDEIAVYETKWQTFEQEQFAIPGTIAPLAKAEVQLDLLLQHVIELEMTMYKALQAQKRIRNALTKMDGGLEKCPEAKDLTINPSLHEEVD